MKKQLKFSGGFPELKKFMEYIKNINEDLFVKDLVCSVKESVEFNLDIYKNKIKTKDEELFYKEDFTISIIETYIRGFLDEFEKTGELNVDEFEILEKSIYVLIDDKKDENGNILEAGIKYLYGSLGSLYEGIGKYKLALDSYKSGLQALGEEKGYYLYGKIGDLYAGNKIDSIDKIFSKKLALENFDKLFNISLKNKDINNYLYSLEKLGDLLSGIDKEEAKEYYISIFENLTINNITDKELIGRVIKKYIKVLENKFEIYHHFDELLLLDEKNLIFIGEYFEKKGDLEYAFLNYLEAIDRKIDGAKEKMIDFLENSLKTKIKKEFEKINFSEFEEVNQEIQKIAKKNNIDFDDIKDSKLELQTIDIAIKNLKKFGRFFRADKEEMFINCLDSEFLYNLDYNSILSYINSYNNEKINSNIILSVIIDFLIKGNFFDEKIKNNLKNIYNKVYNKKKLTNYDLKIIFDVLELKNNPEEMLYYIKNKIFSGKPLEENEKDFLIQNGDYKKLYGEPEEKLYGGNE